MAINAVKDESDVDLMSELRLRQWARNNYIPSAERNDGDWHPIVVDEMRRRDLEIDTQDSLTVITSEGEISLELSRHDRRLDNAHQAVPRPKLISRLQLMAERRSTISQS